MRNFWPVVLPKRARLDSTRTHALPTKHAARPLAMAAELVDEQELATKISSVVETQITNHLKTHDDDLRAMRDAMAGIMSELRSMAAVEEADELRRAEAAGPSARGPKILMDQKTKRAKAEAIRRRKAKGEGLLLGDPRAAAAAGGGAAAAPGSGGYPGEKRGRPKNGGSPRGAHAQGKLIGRLATKARVGLSRPTTTTPATTTTTTTTTNTTTTNIYNYYD